MSANSEDAIRGANPSVECAVTGCWNPRWLDALRLAIISYVLTGFVVVLAVYFGVEFVEPSGESLAPQYHRDLAGRLSAGDGEWFKSIVEEGYSYDPTRPSNVAYFPVYPMLASALVQASGMRTESGLLVVSQLCLLSAFVLFAAYIARRFPGSDGELQTYALYALGLFPTTFVLRSTCADSCFLFLGVLAMYAMQRSWHYWSTAAIIGLASGAHPLGAILIIPFLFYLWDSSSRTSHFLARCVLWLPVCVSGLLAFTIYQQWAFGQPLAFVKTLSSWSAHSGDGSRLLRLLSYEPLWSVYDSSSQCHWSRDAPHFLPWFNLQFAAPVYYLAALLLIVIGAFRRWLSTREWVFGVAMLVLPYIAIGNQSCAASLARHATLAFPVYIVLGHLLRRLSRSTAAAFLAIAGALLGAYTAMFCMGY